MRWFLLVAFLTLTLLTATGCSNEEAVAPDPTDNELLATGTIDTEMLAGAIVARSAWTPDEVTRVRRGCRVRAGEPGMSPARAAQKLITPPSSGAKAGG